jgi:hypothetical protein
MNIDIAELKEITPTKGGKSKPIFSLGKIGYFRGNSLYLEKNRELKNANSVDIKAIKKNNKIVIAFNFKDDKSGKFGINEHKSKKGELRSKSFSGRSIFKHLGLSYTDFAQNKSISFNPKKQEFDNKIYYIIELSIE